MFKLVRKILGSALIVGAGLLPQAHAGLASTVIDFEGEFCFFNLCEVGESFTHADFVMAPTVDFGVIDTVAAFDPTVAPTGNDTQFYFNSNDGGLLLAREDGGKFNLDGFSAAFVPQGIASQTIVVVAYAWFESGDGGAYWSLGTTSPAPSNHPFFTYDDPADFDFFTDVVQVEFFACVADVNGVCQTLTNNNAQFALDDIRVSTFTQDGGGNSTVPEPSTLALLSLGLLGLRLRNRRS